MCDIVLYVPMAGEEYGGPFNEPPLEHLRRFLRAYDSDVFSNVPVLGKKYDHVILGGMGGSGVIGSIIFDFAKRVVDVPVNFIRTNRLPAHTSENTLALVISYSGNTREMLELYDQCIQRGCRMIIITTGGKLAECAEKDGKCMIRVEGGHTPRSDIAFAIGYVASIIDQNCGTSILDSFASAVRASESFADTLSDPEAPDNVAWDIAMKISSKTPFIYSNDDMACVVNRWKCQINENAKIPAASGTFPEFNHNSLEGWGGNTYNGLIPLFIGDSDPYIDAALDLLEEKGNPFLRIEVPGSSETERIVSGMILGDYVSLYLAQILGVNDSPVYSITEFKKRTGGI